MMPEPSPAARPTIIALPDDRLPPQNVEVERAVLGAILLDNIALHEVVPILAADDFFRDTHQILYRIVRELYDAGRPVDLLILSEELRRRGEFEAIGGLDGISEIANSAPHAANAKYHAQIVHEHAIKRNLIEVGNEILREGYGNKRTSDELMEIAERRIFAVGEARAVGDTEEVGKYALDAMDRFSTRQDGEYAGVSTGLSRLDNLTDGLTNSQLVILAARPSIGKTALALNIAEHAAVNLKHPTLFVSLEMAGIELAERLIVSRAGVDGWKFKTGIKLSVEEQRAIGKSYDDVRAARHFRIDDTPIRSMSMIAANARRHKARHGLSLLVIDYIQLVDPGREMARNTSRQEQVSAMSRRLKTLAKELDIPVLALSQLNRNSENREDRRPRLSDLRESGSLEQDADMVFLLHRPEFYDPEDEPGTAELIVAKNRNGQTGTVKLAYRKATTRFEDFEEFGKFGVDGNG